MKLVYYIFYYQFTFNIIVNIPTRILNCLSDLPYSPSASVVDVHAYSNNY